ARGGGPHPRPGPGAGRGDEGGRAGGGEGREEHESVTPEERRAGLGAVGEVLVFGLYGRLRRLRPYQLEVARAVARSVIDGQARGPAPTFTVLFPRQAGKNELSAQLEAFLLFRYQEAGGSMVKVAPTFRPQIVTSLLRLEQM